MGGVPEVTEIFAVIARDEDGTYGIPAINIGGHPIPMMGLNPKNAELFAQIIDGPEIFEASVQEGTTPTQVRLMRFSAAGVEVLKEVLRPA